MKREILFRGKRVDNGEWVEGYLLSDKLTIDFKKGCNYKIILNKEYELVAQLNYLQNPKDYSHLSNAIGKVIPETVGQYTGLKDSEGERIFEGDIVKLTIFEKYYLYWDKSYNSFCCAKNDKNKGYINTYLGLSDFPCSKVIGNIHDNPELLENMNVLKKIVADD
jgi:uncharacterized phage protein (TIGR01671 family)